MSMKIQSRDSKLNFTSYPVRKVVIKSIDNLPVKAMLTKLDHRDPLDLNALEQIQNNAGKKNAILFNLCDDFKKARSYETFYAIEMENGSQLQHEKTVGLMQLLNCRKCDEESLYLTRLTTIPQYRQENSSRSLKGIGEALFVNAFEHAKQINASFLDFVSDANYFYLHLMQKAKVDLNEGAKIDLDMGKFKFFPEVYDKFIALQKKNELPL